MNWQMAEQLAHALLLEMGFDPLEVIQLEDDDLAGKLCGLEEDLAEALLTFFEGLSNDAQIKEAVKRFAASPKDATDLAKWQADSQTWCEPVIQQTARPYPFKEGQV